MKKTLRSIAIVIAILSASPLVAQRYLTEIFDECQTTLDVNYGVNINPLIAVFPNPASGTWVADSTQWSNEMEFINDLIVNYAATNPDTILAYLNFFYPNSALPDSMQTKVKITPLEMDIYYPPASDTETSRATFVYIHTGNFLPPVYNGAVTGDKRDSIAVNMCKQMAKRGYVAVSINYRLGWNPLSEDENVRRGTLLQAVYRSVHDTQTAVRYLKATAANWGIDPEKINLLGQGSGGYVAQAYATLNDYITEIASLDKFIDTDTGFPYVLELRDGNIDGGPGFLRLIDPLYALGVSKEICLSANMGGALADSSWVNTGEPPMVAFHCLRDPYAPFDNGMVVVPTTNENVVTVSGGNVFVRIANELGNNDAFSGANTPTGVYTDAAQSTYGETYDYIYATEPTMTVSESPEGLYPFILPLNGDGPTGVYGNQGAPWDWADSTDFMATCTATPGFDAPTCTAIWGNFLASNPGMSMDKGLTYADTIQGYLHPRVVLACDLVTGIAENVEVQNSMSIFPNPANSPVVIRNDKAEMSELVIMDALGREVQRVNVNGYSYTLNHDGWKSGMYFVTVLFKEGGQLTKKLILK